MVCRALLMVCRALWTVCRALLMVCRALSLDYKVFLMTLYSLSKESFELGIVLLCGDVCVLCKYRVAKTHRIPYLYRSFSAKVTYI